MSNFTVRMQVAYGGSAPLILYGYTKQAIQAGSQYASYKDLPEDIVVSRWYLRSKRPFSAFKYLHTYYNEDYAKHNKHTCHTAHFMYLTHSGESLSSCAAKLQDQVRIPFSQVVAYLRACKLIYKELGMDGAEARTTDQLYTALSQGKFTLYPKYMVKKKKKPAPQQKTDIIYPEIIPPPANTAEELLQQLEHPALIPVQRYLDKEQDNMVAHMTLSARVQGIVTLKKRPGQSVAALFKRISDMHFTEDQLISASSQGCVIRIVAPNEEDTTLSPTLVEDVQAKMDDVVKRWTSWTQ